MSKYISCSNPDCPQFETVHRSNNFTAVVQCGSCNTMMETQEDNVEFNDGNDYFNSLEPDPNVLMREQRDLLLAGSDYRMVSDAPWDTTAWATYRQALRDLPTDPAWPDVDFPVAPE
jgi:hypothetical protein